MAETTKIAWTDATINPWAGCTKISPGCDFCYAEADTKRYGFVGWGSGASRRRTSQGKWGEPGKWERTHEAFFAKHGHPRRVFCASWADVFDNEAPAEWRQDLFDLIRSTPNLIWMLLSKRIGNAPAMIAECGGLPPNVWVGMTVVNRREFTRDIDKLRAVECRIRFISFEPLLAPVGPVNFYGVSWAICGGESGRHARPMKPQWAREIRDQCKEQGVTFFHKQNGGRGSDKGGCLLDGVEHKEWPE